MGGGLGGWVGGWVGLLPERRMKAGRISVAYLRLPLASEMAPMMGGEITSPVCMGRWVGGWID